MRKALLENVNGLSFAGGFVAFEIGLTHWWSPAAWMVGGLIVMAIAARPYLRSR